MSQVPNFATVDFAETPVSPVKDAAGPGPKVTRGF